MRYKKIIKINLILCILILFLSILNATLFAEDTINDKPKIRIGINGEYGYYNVNNTYGDYPDWKEGFGFGGGIIFESMFTDVFGVHSGLGYSRFKLNLIFPDDSSETTEETIIEHKITTDLFTMPLYLITSFGSDFITFNLLAGFNFTYIVESHMTPGPDGGTTSEDIKQYLYYAQMGAGGGVEFLFRLTRFTKLFISCTGEYYLTDLISDSDSNDYLYNFKIKSGFMICTF